jgi:Tol biopolymer transport system component
MNPLAALVLSAALLGSTGAAAVPPPPILFAADNLPAVRGEIYRLDANGRRIDLSKSAFDDFLPVVAPDGKRVAFVSTRSGSTRIYQVGIDGSGLRILDSPPLVNPYQLVWEPDSRALAVAWGSAIGRVTVVAPGRKASVIGRGQAVYGPEWSADGRLVTVTAGNLGHRQIEAFTPAGQLVWRVPFDADAGWSSRGVFAAYGHAGITGYDEAGHARFHFAGRIAAWSPAGGRLASVVRGRIEVRTADGRLFLRKTVPGLAGRRVTLLWPDSRRVLVDLLPRVVGLDTATGKLVAGWGRYVEQPHSGNLFAETPKRGDGFAVRVTSLPSGAGRLYGHVPGCFDDGVFGPAIDSLQFVPGRHSLVYTTNCAEPFSALYAVQPDGTGLMRLTHASEQQVEPAWSPDGTRIAYTRFDHTGFSCKGCPGSLAVADADGSHARLLTTPTGGDFEDGSASWSPDGTQLLFGRANFSKASELFTVPAAGGVVRDLHLVGSDASWGPTRIAYVTPEGEALALYTARPDGSDPQLVAKAGGTDTPRAPAWSHDGRLAYLLGTKVVVPDGATVALPFRRIFGLAWSPDGTHFVLTGVRPGEAVLDVYAVRTDGTDLLQLTKNLDAAGVDWR